MIELEAFSELSVPVPDDVGDVFFIETVIGAVSFIDTLQALIVQRDEHKR